LSSTLDSTQFNPQLINHVVVRRACRRGIHPRDPPSPRGRGRQTLPQKARPIRWLGPHRRKAPAGPAPIRAAGCHWPTVTESAARILPKVCRAAVPVRRVAEHGCPSRQRQADSKTHNGAGGGCEGWWWLWLTRRGRRSLLPNEGAPCPSLRDRDTIPGWQTKRTKQDKAEPSPGRDEAIYDALPQLNRHCTFFSRDGRRSECGSPNYIRPLRSCKQGRSVL
jgi:hypothetical protein